MDWGTLAILIVQNGLPLALKLAEKWGSKDVVTPQEIAELKALGAQTAESQMTDALTRAGLLDSVEGKALLALVKK